MAWKQAINEGLIKERTKCTFDIEELTNFLDDGREYTERRRKLGRYIGTPR